MIIDQVGDKGHINDNLNTQNDFGIKFAAVSLKVFFKLQEKHKTHSHKIHSTKEKKNE